MVGVHSARLEYEARRLFYTLEHSTMDKADTALSVALEATRESLVSGDYSALGGEVDALLAMHKLTALDPSGPSARLAKGRVASVG